MTGHELSKQTGLGKLIVPRAIGLFNWLLPSAWPAGSPPTGLLWVLLGRRILSRSAAFSDPLKIKRPSLHPSSAVLLLLLYQSSAHTPLARSLLNFHTHTLSSCSSQIANHRFDLVHFSYSSCTGLLLSCPSLFFQR